MSEEDERVPITSFQIFVLSYLYSEELFLENREQELDKTRLATHHLQSRITRNSIEINVKELATIAPPSVITEELTVAEIVRQLSLLVSNGYLERSMLGSSAEGFGSVSITADGILIVKKILGDFQRSVKNKKHYDKKIERVEGNSKTKEWFKGMWNTFKDKAQDEIVDLILSQAKTHGPQLIGFMIRFIQNGS